jgi:peptide/nickel transport system substrate-binding protein
MTMTVRPSRRDFFSLSATTLGAAVISRMPRGYAAEPKRGGTVTMVVSAEPSVLTSIANTAFNSVLTSGKVNEGLLTYDFNLIPQPQLATAWFISPDGLKYTFKLRPGVKWHDGKEFTSADVAYSLQTITQVHPRGRNTFGNLVDIQTPDALTAVLVLSKPAPYLISALAGSETPIVARHLYEGTDPATNPVNNAPVGTGPYVFKEWQRGSAVVLERNPNYWDPGKPYIDRLVIRFMTDPAARAIAIENREVQLAPETPVAYNDLNRLKSLSHIGFETRGYLYSNSISLVAFNLDRSFFKDPRVRKAFSHVIDRRIIHKVINYGYGEVLNGPVSPKLTKWYDPDIPLPQIDVPTAEKLLDAAGFPRNSDGIRQKLHLDYVPSGDTFARGSDYVRQALARVGIDVTVRAQDFATYTKRIYTDRDYDFAFEGFSNLFDPTVGVQRLYWSKNFKPGVPFSNGSHYVNPKVDALLEQAAVELDDAKRVAEWREAQELVVADLPDVYMVAAPEITLYDRNVTGHTVTGDGLMGNLADLSRIA